MIKLRINKYLAASGIASRRKADEMVLEGRIRLNGNVIREPGTLVDPRKDLVEADGMRVAGPERLSYLLLNKPAGYVTTARDPEGRPTVMDLVPDRATRVFPVGRLDFDSEGLLFLMNDGKLAFRLTHPRYEVEKTYRVALDRPPDQEELDKVRAGVVLDDERTAPARVTRSGTDSRTIEITIHEGRNRQVRRVFEAVGLSVLRLRRVRFGTIPLGDLKAGEWREMTSAEIRGLRKLVGLNP